MKWLAMLRRSDNKRIMVAQNVYIGSFYRSSVLFDIHKYYSEFHLQCSYANNSISLIKNGFITNIFLGKVLLLYGNYTSDGAIINY